jgi:hypothetical protein
MDLPLEPIPLHASLMFGFTRILDACGKIHHSQQALPNGLTPSSPSPLQSGSKGNAEFV